jgi:hypothetical protein
MSHIEIKLVADTATDLTALIAGLHAQLGGAAIAYSGVAQLVEDEVVVGRIEGDEGKDSKSAAPAATRASSSAKKTSDPAPASPEATEGKPDGAASTGTDTPAGGSDDEQAVAYTDVQKATNDLAKAKGTSAVRTILGTFDVDHATKLTEEQWPNYIAACNLAAEG